ncbi:MAG TPA: AMP-binding protein [Acidimicrobiales bacterium]|nr:AMP-binding protein [Acidimicrobiales bacterium]
MTQIGTHPRGVAAVAAAHPDRLALIDGDRRVTYGELDQLANGLAALLAEHGVGPGDAVGIMAHNRAEWFTVSHAVARLGAMWVPVSPRLTPYEADYIIDDSKMKVLVAEGSPTVGVDGVAVVDIDGPDLARTAAEPPFPDYLNAAPAMLGYTSGTTGRPKAVERPAPVPVPVATTSPVAAFWGYGPDTVQLVCGPFYHTAPSSYAEYALWEGGVVVVQDGFVGDRCLTLIEEHRVTRTFMVPAHFVRILEADWKRRDRSSLRMVLHAAAMCPVPVKWRILEVFPPGTLWEFYGATEGMGTIISPGEWLFKPGSVGRPFPGLHVKVLGDDGNETPPGEVGGIYISPMGGYRFSYRGDPEKTANAYRDGYFTAGDLGWIDEDGYLYIADRRTDLIVSGGVNIYPAEVESALVEDPDVTDAAVIGLPDERMGQRVHAIVEMRPGAVPDEEALVARLAERLADYKRPRTIEFVAQLPREPTGKVRKHQLREARLDRAGAPSTGGPA